jgi:1-acyl-sn-glycerol-3-phosphate acyltransferase
MTQIRTLETAVLCGLARILTGVTVRGAVPEPSDLRTFVFYANHSSHLDAVVLWLSLPPQIRARTRPVAARDYWDRDGLRRHLATEVLQALLIDRGKTRAEGRSAAQLAVEALDSMATALEQGSSLILFPEGTRGSGEELAPFRSGLYRLAKKRPATSFVPVFLENLNRILPKGEFLPVPVLGSAFFGEPFRIEDNETRDSFLGRSRDALATLGETEN